MTSNLGWKWHQTWKGIVLMGLLPLTTSDRVNKKKREPSLRVLPLSPTPVCQSRTPVPRAQLTDIWQQHNTSTASPCQLWCSQRGLCDRATGNEGAGQDERNHKDVERKKWVSWTHPLHDSSLFPAFQRLYVMWWELWTNKYIEVKYFFTGVGIANNTIPSQNLGHDIILLWFFTFDNTTSIAIRFSDTSRFISPIYYVL